MNARFAALGVLIILAAACSDDKRNQPAAGLTTSPSAPRLTMKNLPSSASTICVANVRKRDDVLSKNPTADHDALDAAIDDVCQ